MASTQEKQTEIRIYPSFTEVRENVSVHAPVYSIYLQQDLYSQILNGSLSLENVRVLAQNAVLRDSNLEGKVLHIQRGKDTQQTRQVKVVRARDMLVQDVETGRFYHAQRDQLEFDEQPEETGTEVTFTLDSDSANAILSYLMNGINWKPRYNLNIPREGTATASTHEFQAWADINNSTQREYRVRNTELFGGDVSIHRAQPRAYAMADSASYGSVRTMAMARSAPTIKSEGEMSGLYMYSIGDSFLLEPRSTYSLPFLSPKIDLEKLAVYEGYFNPSNHKGKFSRVYRLSSSEFLPAGSVTVREDGRVVGQRNIPNLSKDEKHDLNVGNDSDVSIEREVRTLSVSEKVSQYECVLKLTNAKQRNVKYELLEQFGQQTEVVSVEPQSVKASFVNFSLKHQSTLPANGSFSIKYVINVHN